MLLKSNYLHFRQLRLIAGFFYYTIIIIHTMTIDEKQTTSSNHNSVAGPIIVIALSIAAVVILYLAVGHIGPTYSSNVMAHQQARLRHQYDLPPKPVITNPKILQIPPSLRHISNNTHNSNSE
jgi:hypothetical protein